MTILLIILGVVYITGTIIMYGISFSYWQNDYPKSAEEQYKGDVLFSILIGILWFIAILNSKIREDSLSSYKKNGMKFK